MRLQVANTTTTMYYSVTNAVPAKPYLPIASGANTYYLPLTTATLAGVKLKVQSGNATYRACTYQSGYYNTTSAAVGNLSSTTALTRASTSATLTRASTSATLTRASTSATLTRASTSATLTRASTSATLTRASTSATLTRASTSATLTRSSISGYATGSSTVNYTIEAWTKPIVNKTSYRSIYFDYETIGYFTNTEYSDAKVSGNIIVNHWESWQEGGNVTTTSPTNFVDKFAFRETSSPYPKVYNYTTWYNGSQVPMLYAYFTISGNTARTSSSTQPLQSQPQYYSTAEVYFQSTYIINGVSTNSPFPWTSWFYTGQWASRTKNTYVTISSNTNHRLYIYGNIFSTQTTSMTYTWWHAWSSYRLSNPFHSSYAMWVTATTTSHTHIVFMEYRSREVVNTFSTKKVTTATLTRSSISGYGTRSSISGYGTRSSISGYGTRSSISGYATRSSISGYGTRSSISGYGTRSSISGYGTRSSISGYSGKLSSSKWA